MIKPKPLKERTTKDTLFEKLPPMIFVIALVFLFFGGIFWPEVTAYLIIFINVYFLYKSVTLAVTFPLSFLKLRQAEGTNWRGKLEALLDKKAARELIEEEIREIEKQNFDEGSQKRLKGIRDNFITKFSTRLPSFFQKVIFERARIKSIRYLQKELRKIEKQEVFRDWRDIQQVIIIPHVKEPEHILRETLQRLKNQTFPQKNINIVLAAESRDPNGLPLSEKLAKEFRDDFNNIWISNHVLGDDEIVGKSSNMRAGGIKAYEEVKKQGWDLKNVIVTSCDADSKLPEQYFSYVTYEYVTRDDAEYKFFTGAMVFYNNIWRLPFYARVKNSMNTLYNVGRLIRSDKLIPFSTYSTSLWLVNGIDFWTPWVTPEDFHMFFKAHFKYGGLVSTIPIYVRVLSDAAEGLGHLDTIKNNYNQEKRWSWGVSDDGWVLQNIVYGIGRYDVVTLYRALHSVFDHVMTPVLSIMLIVGGNIPPFLDTVFKTTGFSSTVLGAGLPQISSAILTTSMVFMILLVVMDLLLKPERKTRLGPFIIIIQLAEWLVLPIASFILAVLPGLEAHTRLLFGRYLEYYVTKKH